MQSSQLLTRIIMRQKNRLGCPHNECEISFYQGKPKENDGRMDKRSVGRILSESRN